MKDLFTPRQLVLAMYDSETEAEDVEGIRQALRQERMVAQALLRKRAIMVKIYNRIVCGFILLVVPLILAVEIWPGLRLIWMKMASVWTVVMVIMVAFLFVIVRSEEKKRQVER